MSLSLKLIRNIIANYAGMFVTILTGFLLTPFIVHHLGDTAYGIWGLVGTVISYFSLLDLGMSTSVAKYVAQYDAQGRLDLVNRVVSTLFFVYCLLAALASVAIVILTLLLPETFQIPIEYKSLARIVFLISGLNFMFVLPTSIFNAILVGYQRIDLNNLTGIGATTINAILTVVLFKLGFGLVALALITLLTALILAAGRLYAIRRTCPELSIQLTLFRRDIIPEIMRFSLVVFGLQIMFLVIFGLDNVVIGFFLPVAAITPFAIAYKLADFIHNLVRPLILVFFPAFAELNGRADWEILQRLYVEGTKIATALAVPITTFLLVEGGAILNLWMGTEYVSSAILLSLLALGVLSHVIRETGAMMLIGTGVVRRFFYANCACGLGNLVLSVILVQHYGLRGVALGTLIPILLVDWLYVIPHACRTADVPLGRLLGKAILPSALPLIPATSLLFFLPGGIGESWGLLAIRTVLFVAVYVGGYLVFCVSREERHNYARRLASLWRRADAS